MMRKLFVISCCALIQSCTVVDDYMLGKDNTPKPQALAELHSKVSISPKWTVPVSSGSHSNSYAKMDPVLRGNTLFTAGPNGRIDAVDKTNAHVLWSTQVSGGIVSGPSVSQGFLAVATDKAKLVLLNQTTGKEVWQAPLSSEMLSKPLITLDKVIAKTIDGKLYAFDLVNGKRVWVVDHGSPALILKASSTPVIAGNLVLVGYSDGKMDAVDLQTGQVVWQKSIGYGTGPSDVERLTDIDADPIVSGNIAYIATYQGSVGALSLKDGQFIWNKPISTYKNMILKNNNLLVSDSDDVVWSINAQSGHINWKQEALKARGLTQPVVTGSRLLVGDKTGLLHAISLKSGNLIGRTKLSGPIISAPVAANDKQIYVLTANGLLNEMSVG